MEITQTLIAQLYLGNVTYAEFAAKRQMLANASNEGIVNIQTELQKRDSEAKARAQQLALQANQNMILAIQTFSQSMHMRQQNNLLQKQIRQNQMNARRPPPIIPSQTRISTTCNFVGNTLFCN